MSVMRRCLQVIPWLLVAMAFFAGGFMLHQSCLREAVAPPDFVSVMGYDSEGWLDHFVQLRNVTAFSFRHPLLCQIMSPVTVVAHFVSVGWGAEVGKRVVLVFFALIGGVNVWLLWTILLTLKVPCRRRMMAILLWLSLAHVWLLGGMAESFSISMTLLLVCMLLVVRRVEDWRIYCSLAVICGCVTLTNMVKPLLAAIIVCPNCRRDRFHWTSRALLTVLAFGGILVGGLSLKWRFLDGRGVCEGVAKIAQDIARYFPTGMDCGGRLWHAWNSFVCDPICLHQDPVAQSVISVGYTSPWPQVAVVAVIGLCLWSVVVNRKNAVVQVMLSMLGVDVLLHVVVGWGIAEGQVYCGHWLWIVPLFIGILPGKESPFPGVGNKDDRREAQ